MHWERILAENDPSSLRSFSLLLAHIFSLKTQFIPATLVSILFSSPSLHHFPNFNREKDIESDKRRLTRKMKSWRIRKGKMKTRIRKKNYTASGTKMGQGFKVHTHSRNGVYILYILYICIYMCIKGLRIFFDCRIKGKKKSVCVRERERVKINIERRKPSIRWPVRGFFIAFRDKAHAKDQPSKRFFVGRITWLSSTGF